MVQEPTAAEAIRVPVCTFTRPETGSRVTYVSTVHVGESAYWAELAAIIEQVESEGGRIYYERVRRPSPEELEAASEELRWGAPVVERKLAAGTLRASAIGLVAQKEGLPQRDGWEAHDVDMLRAAEIYGIEELRRQDERLAQFEQLEAQMTPEGRRAMLTQTLTAALAVVTGGAALKLPGVEAQMAVIREGVVLDALDAYRARVPDARVALVWGVGHLPAFADALADRGYKPDGDEWVTMLSI